MSRNLELFGNYWNLLEREKEGERERDRERERQIGRQTKKTLSATHRGFFFIINDVQSTVKQVRQKTRKEWIGALAHMNNRN